MRFPELASIYALRGRVYVYLVTRCFNRVQAVNLSWSLQYYHWPNPLGAAQSWTVKLKVAGSGIALIWFPFPGLPITSCLLQEYLQPKISLPLTTPGVAPCSVTLGVCSFLYNGVRYNGSQIPRAMFCLCHPSSFSLSSVVFQ